MKQKIIYFLSITLFIGFLYYFFRNNPELFDNIKNIPTQTLLMLFVLSTVSLSINGYFLKIITSPFGVTIKNHFWLSATTSLLNLVTPFRGGAVFRAWYLKKKYNLNMKDIFITIAGSYPIIFFTNSLMGILILVYQTYHGSNVPLWGWFFFIGIFISTLALFFIPEIKYKIFKKVNILIQGWHKISKNKNVLIRIFLLQILFTLISATSIYIISQEILLNLTIYQAILIASFMVFSIVINLTPGGIGITEFFFVLAAVLVSSDIEQMMLLSIIIRGIGSSSVLLWGIFGKIILLKNL